MPELPEVETVCKTLEKVVIGHSITNIKIMKPKCIKNTDAENFKNTLINKKIISISRLGKHIIFHMSNDVVFVSHLRMEGRYYYENQQTPINKHTMVIFDLDNGQSLRYIDTRQFGTFHLYTEQDYLKSEQLSKLGYEPWDKELTSTSLYNKVKKSTRAIKATILDQTIITGIGNIYADEILFSAKICPWKKTNEITIQEFKKIIKETKRILSLAIEMKGSTINSYESSHGVEGTYQTLLKVHTKKGFKCPVCKTEIQKTKVGGRGTYYCPKCQCI